MTFMVLGSRGFPSTGGDLNHALEKRRLISSNRTASIGSS